MERLTNWTQLWADLSELQNKAFLRKKTDQEDDFWKHKAKQFDKMVEKRWEKPDSSRNFLIQKLKDNPGSTLLDIGAGTGKWSLLTASFAKQVTAFEPSTAMQDVLREKMIRQGVNNIDIVTGSWPKDEAESHDYILASHSMYGVADFKGFVAKMCATAKKACILVLRAPFMDSIMAQSSRKVLGQPYDSPNFQIAYNLLLEMDIFPDVIMEADGSWPGWENDTFDAALTELKNRLGVLENPDHDAYLSGLLKEQLTQKEDRVSWPAGNRSALVYWKVAE